jgi:hypothetical protein
MAPPWLLQPLSLILLSSTANHLEDEDKDEYLPGGGSPKAAATVDDEGMSLP